MLTQIIAGDSLLQLGRKVHDVRALCCIPQYCGCPMSKDIPHKSTNGICKVINNLKLYTVTIVHRGFHRANINVLIVQKGLPNLLSLSYTI
jgi:hypothetical protein